MIVLLDNMTDKRRDKVNYEVARRLVTEAKFGAEHLIEPDTFQVDANKDAACIAQQLAAEQLGYAGMEVNEEEDQGEAPSINPASIDTSVTPVLAV